MFKELVDAWKEAGAERLKNPFLGAFTGFMIVVNWRVVVFLFFGEADASERVAYISNYLKTTPLYESVGWPLVSAALFVILMPWISNFFRWVRSFADYFGKQQKLNHEYRLISSRVENEKKKIELRGYKDKTELGGKIQELEDALEVSKKNFHEVAQQNNDKQKTIEDKNNEIYHLEKKVEKLEAEIDPKPKTDIAGATIKDATFQPTSPPPNENPSQ